MSIITSPLLLGADGVTQYQISRSLRFNAGDSAYCNRTFGTPTTQGTFTLSMWVKRSGLGSAQSLFGVSTNHRFGFTSGDALNLTFAGTSALTTTAVFRDPSAWYHIVWTQSGTSHTVYVNGISQGTATATSSVFNTAVAHQLGASNTTNFFSGYLADVYFIDGQALTPSSFTATDATTGQLIPKAYTGSYGTNGFKLNFSDNSTAAALGTDTSGNSNTWTVNNISVRQVVQASYNSTYGSNITSGEAAKIFDGDLSTYGVANGDFVGFSYSGTAIAIKVENTAGTTKSFYIQPWVSGSAQNSGTFNTSGTNLWTVPASTTATAVFTFPAGYDGFARLYTNGLYADLRFYDIRTAQSEAAGNDSLVDTPTSYGTDTGAGGEVRGNYATLNPLAATAGTFSNGNLQLATVLLGYPIYTATQYTPAGTGKWYWEFTINSQTGTNYTMLGMLPSDSTYRINQDGHPFSFGGISTYIGYDGVNYAASGAATASGTPTATITTGDIVGWAFDAANGTVVIYKNNVSQGTCYTNVKTTVGWTFAFSDYDNTSASTVTVNFGQRPFAYTAPSGFKALCDTNLPAPVVAKPNTVMDAVLYTGTGATLTPTSTLGFSPDLVWIKSRSAATDNTLYDVVRGVQARLESNTTDAEVTTDGGVTAFNSAGFTLGTLAQVNTSSATYAAWCWDAGTSTVTNTAGSITSQVRANASAGFSIVTYTQASGAQTVGHGLGVAPSLIITKARNQINNWFTYSLSIPVNNYLALNSTIASTVYGVDIWNGTRPTSTVFSVGADLAGYNYVAYCFAPVSGYSSFGSYTGNGSADGPFVYLGFRPAVVIVKMTSSTGNWTILDSKREGYNVDNDPLFPNLADAEGTTDLIDITSNGFKVRTTNATFNTNAGTYVYAAWAESPFAYSRAR